MRATGGKPPANEGLDLVTLSNSTALFGALRSGEIDVLLSTSLEGDHKLALHQDAAAGRLKEGVGPAFEISYLTLLSDQPPLNDPSLRRAVALSLDRATISRRVGLGLQPALRELVPPSLPGSVPTAWPAYDPAAARALYRKAGYCDGKRLSLPLTFRSNIPNDRLFALTWQAQLRRDLDDCVQAGGERHRIHHRLQTTERWGVPDDPAGLDGGLSRLRTTTSPPCWAATRRKAAAAWRGAAPWGAASGPRPGWRPSCDAPPR